ncbi:MAG: CpaE-like family protein [Actinomycetota bacterium]|nr:CpaE-like family protein [Actinomycetota bacterium]
MTVQRPLLVTTDDLLLEEVLRLAAAAGVVLEVAHDVAAALRGWSAAGLVLVGADLADALGGTRPSRREHVHVVARGPVPHELFRAALAMGAENVAELPVSETWLVETLTDAGDGGAARGVTIGVIGGSGGAGATVFASALAVTLGSSWRTLLVDTDPLGAGIDRVLGMESLDGIRWDALNNTTGRLSARSLRDALPHRAGVSLLTWSDDRPTGLQAFAVREALSAGQRGHDAIVLDLPRHPDKVIEEVLSRCDHVVLVCGVTVPAVTAASRVSARLAGVSSAVHLVVRGSGGVDPAEIARVLHLPLAAAMPDQRGLDEAVDLGAGPIRSRRGALARSARLVAGRVVRPAALVA